MSDSGEQEIELLVLDNREKNAEHQITRSQHNIPVCVDEINHGLENSRVKRKKITEPLSLAGVQELRGILSEALNTSLFKFAVVIVFVFNFSYSLFNSFRQDSLQDDFSNKCHCNGRHKTFYVTIIVISTVVWLLILVLEKFYTQFVHPGRYDHHLLELIRDNLQFQLYFTMELNMLLSAVYDDQNNMDKLIAKLKKEQMNNDIAGTMPAFGLPDYLKSIFPNVMPTMYSGRYCKKSFFSSAKDNASRHYRHFCKLKCRHKAVVGFKLFLIANQFVSQLLIVPLLELQWLDQYAWVCVVGISRNYCNSDKDIYNLALDQAIVVYMFYASILFAALLSVIIGWLPEYNDKQV